MVLDPLRPTVITLNNLLLTVHCFLKRDRVVKLLMDESNFETTLTLLCVAMTQMKTTAFEDLVNALVEVALMERSFLGLMQYFARSELAGTKDENTLFRELSPFICLLVELLKREPAKAFMNDMLAVPVKLAQRLDSANPDSATHVALFVLRQLVMYGPKCPKLLVKTLVRSSS